VLRFSILGPLAAEADDGTALNIARPSQRTTLAVLLTLASQPVTKAALIDALWGDNPPGDPETALRVRIRDLRRALGAHDCLETHQQGYRIRVRPGELDADNFRSLVAHGRAALDGGNTEDSARVLDQACRLWREPPLADLPDTPAMRTAATALLEQLRDAREWLGDARLALGQHHEVLGQVRDAVASEPLREHPHVQLMLALYRCGQKAAALAAYGRLRDLTTRELGQEPGPEAREMLGMILDDSPYLQARPRVGRPGSSRGPGGVLAVMLDSRPAWTPVCQLPAPPPDFTGRVAVIHELARQMVVVPPVTGRSATVVTGPAVTVISGPPGAGKTALGVKAAQLATADFPDGQLYVDLGGAGQPREPSEVLAELVRSLGVPDVRVPAEMAERAALYRSLLARRRVLVLADDAATAAQVRPLLPGTPGSAILITSSRWLADVEGARHVTVSALSAAEAGGLLCKIVGKDRVDAEPDGFAAVIAACAGLPLALRIAGARIAADPALRLADFAGTLADDGRLLTELVVGDLSVRRRLDAAWFGLDVNGRRTLRTLALTHLRDLAPDRVRCAAAGAPAVLQSLVDAGLIWHDAGVYHLAPLIGCYAAAQPPP
jgi:DNA-binding SARP family transcriptional activator